MSRDQSSADSLIQATRSRAQFSGHGNAKGAAGLRVKGDGRPGEFLSDPGETAIINPHEHGYEMINIGLAWDNVSPSGNEKGFLKRLLGRTPVMPRGVDLDLGCLYELKNGQRGCIQAFGEMFGDLENAPYINLSGDERTGDAEGDDESILVNGAHWPDIKRLLLYVYIYDGVPDWSTVRPQVQVRVPGEPPLVVTPNISRKELAVCAVATLENIRGGIRLTNHTEYFPGHAEMDRAFGFGLSWADGQKA